DLRAIESRGWSVSINRRLASGELGRFFFQPLDLHLQAADLLEELLLVGGLLVTPRAAVLEQPGRLREQLLLPGRDLAGMHARIAGQLGRRLVPSDRRQSHLGLERRPKHTPLPRHPGTLLIRSSPHPETTPYQRAQFLGSTSR